MFHSMLLHLSSMCTDYCIELVPVLDVTPRTTLDDLDDLYNMFQRFIACFSASKYVKTKFQFSFINVCYEYVTTSTRQ